MESSGRKLYSFRALTQEALFQKPIKSHPETIGGMRIGRMNRFFGEAMKALLEFAKEKHFVVKVKSKDVRSSSAVIEMSDKAAQESNKMLVHEHLGYLTPTTPNPTVLQNDEDLTRFMEGSQ